MDTMGNFGEGVKVVDVERFAAILACVAYETRELRLEFNILGLRENGNAMGDWRIIVECINLPGHNC